MKLLNKIRERLSRSPRARSILLYLFFVIISAVFWSFLTFNRNVQLELVVPVELDMPENIHLLGKEPSSLTVTVRDRGYRFFFYMFHKSPKLVLKFADYIDGKNMFKMDQEHLKKALAHVLSKNTAIVSVLPESINLLYTDQPGKKVPVKPDIYVVPREDYAQYGALRLSQDSVVVYSDAETLSTINEVYTYRVEKKDLTDTLRRSVNIQPITGAVIEPHSINIMVPIEKLKEQTRSVKIDVRNAPPGIKMLLVPSDVEVTYLSPVSRITEDAGITAVVDYRSVDFKSRSNKVAVVIGEAPAAYQDVKHFPDSVEYIIEKH